MSPRPHYTGRLVAPASLAVPLLALVLAGSRGATQTPPATSQPSPPAFRAGVELVVIDVTVLGRDDAPVEGLTADDFVVTIDGAPRKLASARFVRAEAAAAPGAAPATPSRPSEPVPAGAPASPTTADTAGRTFIIVVDRDRLPAGGGRSHLEAAARFVDALGPQDRVGLWTLPVASTSLRFLGDREQLKRELLNAVGTRRRVNDCFVITPEEAYAVASMNDARTRSEVVGRECQKMCAPCGSPLARNSPSCQGEANPCPRMVDQAVRDEYFGNQAALQQTESALRALIDALSPLEGQKHLVLVTAGTYLPQNELLTVTSLGQFASAARVHVHALQVWNPLEAISPEISGPTSVPQIDQNATAEVALAGVSGGTVVTSPQGEAGFKRLTRELAAWYVLGVEAQAGDRDGKPHTIRVTLPTRKDVVVRSRQQFVIRPGTTPAVIMTARPAGATPAGATPAPGLPDVEEAPVSSPSAAGAVRLEDLLARFATYIERFEREFSGVVARERYVQVVHPWRGNPKGPDAEPSLVWTDDGATPKWSAPIITRRLLESDVLLVTIPGGRWVGYRDVAVVDGKAVRDRAERVRELFLSRAANRDEQLVRVAQESARYNLGSFRRTLNVPTVPLFLLHPRNHARFDFKLADSETIDGFPTAVLRYKERMRPTLIGTPNGGDVFIEGRLWLEPSTGRVIQTELRFQSMSERRSSLVTRYQRVEGLPVDVPTYMWEWYEGSNVEGRIGGDKVVTECLARYAEFRRFTVETTETVK